MLKLLMPLLLLPLLAGCSPDKSADQTTRQCLEYQHMMTAPLPPDVHAGLEKQCEDSLKSLHEN
ncbi:MULTISPECIES: hypothetical protein [unclassified Tatumella]|uniref:hypothetical protein n=1 Tax=unclassified Tatumella TaxID=2649542 RepID=UPI001BAF52AB|nr:MULTISPECIES: hypothetical protein [unclassified Tatumella]MBS0856504.1 hypothetical protein [Tatumella sp. JGM16]MBS0876242.1 hypothetical protein [Tatumella sp. JGM82]MBS0889291.1 hypothetical protein [Tatumella sp. JGM94]MBS0902295.1 hypothetical protein [Tatumella sp. JGM100]MBS0911504.1 hypothetical protein [Tatumella sp. JGM91]